MTTRAVAEGPATVRAVSDATDPAAGAAGEGIARFVEDVGLFFEASGLPRAAGRMLGWLLVCEPEHQSADDLARGLRASSGGVSQSARLLVQAGYIERVGISGDRRVYHRIREHAWTRILDEQQAMMARLREIAEHGLDLLEGASPPRRERLAEMREVFSFLEREMPVLVRRYHEARGD